LTSGSRSVTMDMASSRNCCGLLTLHITANLLFFQNLPALGQRHDIRFLQPEQILLIDHALEQVGQFGEVRLIVEKGKLRFIEISQSMDVTKLQD